MQAFRLVKARDAAATLDGEGARLAGGRWNAPGLPVAYCASSLSLAILELLVHVDPGSFPEDLVAIRVEIPDDLALRRVLPAELPGDWRREPGRGQLRALGTAWLRAQKEAVLAVPSVIVPGETNLLVNPRHPDAVQVRVLATEPFSLDARLF